MRVCALFLYKVTLPANGLDVHDHFHCFQLYECCYVNLTNMHVECESDALTCCVLSHHLFADVLP